MPELPELEVIKEVLQAHIVGQTITEEEVRRPWVLRDLTGGVAWPWSCRKWQRRSSH